ncbi:hypothetical protein T484DRAFT_1897764 [Baffinella frigidus]|nr:hypothetical protein T484DRAFT_1897764 [Cryptophyta sp. CCMP2293]
MDPRRVGAEDSRRPVDPWEQLQVSGAQLLGALREFRGMVEPRGGFSQMIGGCCACGTWLTVPARAGGRNFDFHHITGADDPERQLTCRTPPFAGEEMHPHREAPRWDEDVDEFGKVGDEDVDEFGEVGDEDVDEFGEAGQPDEDVDEFGEAGQPCTICFSELRSNTHFAVPCRHAACEACWDTWLEQHDTCMICAKRVRSTVRFSERLAPLYPEEAARRPGLPGSPDVARSETGGSIHAINTDLEAALAALGAGGAIHAINTDLEAALAALVRSVVHVRSLLSNVSGRLEAIKGHLDRRRMRDMGADARQSVASVEASSFGELLDELRTISGTPGAGPWHGVTSSVARATAVLSHLGDALDASHHARAIERLK